MTFNAGVPVFGSDRGHAVAFEVGFVPVGWKRGQPLRVMRAKPSWPGFVSLDHTKLSFQDNLSADAVGIVRFTVDDAASLEAWLEWWNLGAGE